MIIFTVYNEDVQPVQNCLIFSGEICSHIPQVTCPRLGDFLHDCKVRTARGRQSLMAHTGNNTLRYERIHVQVLIWFYFFR